MKKKCEKKCLRKKNFCEKKVLRKKHFCEKQFARLVQICACKSNCDFIEWVQWQFCTSTMTNCDSFTFHLHEVLRKWLVRSVFVLNLCEHFLQICASLPCIRFWCICAVCLYWNVLSHTPHANRLPTLYGNNIAVVCVDVMVELLWESMRVGTWFASWADSDDECWAISSGTIWSDGNVLTGCSNADSLSSAVSLFTLGLIWWGAAIPAMRTASDNTRTWFSSSVIRFIRNRSTAAAHSAWWLAIHSESGWEFPVQCTRISICETSWWYMYIHIWTRWHFCIHTITIERWSTHHTNTILTNSAYSAHLELFFVNNITISRLLAVLRSLIPSSTRSHINQFANDIYTNQLSSLFNSKFVSLQQVLIARSM